MTVARALALPSLVPRPRVGPMAYARVGGVAPMRALPCVRGAERATNRDGRGHQAVAGALGRVLAAPDTLCARLARSR